MATDLGKAKFTIIGDLGSFESDLTRLVGSLTGISTSFGVVGIAAAGAVAGLAALGAAAAGIGVVTVKAAEFENTITRAASKTDSFEGALVRFGDAAIEAGLKSAFSANEAAQALDILATAGFSTGQAIAAVDPVLQLAQAGMVDLATAADITASVLRGFNKDTSELAGINDVLVAAFTGANQTVGELGQALRKVAPIAAASGQEFNTVVAALSLLSNAGIKAEEGGTALKVAFARLLKPVPKVSQALKDLGVNVSAGSGKLKDFSVILKDLEEAGADASDFVQIFGQRSGPALASLLNAGSRGLDDFIVRLENAGGAAQQMSDRQLSTLSGQMQILKGTVETVAITFGNVFIPIFKPLVKLTQKSTLETLKSGDALDSLKSAVIGGVGALVSLVTVIETLAPAIVLVGSAVVLWAQGFAVIANVASAVRKVIFSLATGTLGLLSVALSEVITGIGKVARVTDKEFGQSLIDAGKSVGEFGGKLGRLADEELRSLDENVDDMAGTIKTTADLFLKFEERTDSLQGGAAALSDALKKGIADLNNTNKAALLAGEGFKGAGDEVEKFEKKVRKLGELEKLLIELEPTIKTTSLKGGAIERGFKLKKKIEVDFEAALADLEPTFADVDILPKTVATLKAIDDQVKAESKLLFGTISNITGSIAGIFGDTAKQAADMAVAIGEGFISGGPLGALTAGASGVASLLADGASSLIDMAKETEAFQKATERVAVGMDALEIPELDSVMEEFMQELIPVVEIFNTVAEALGPIGGIGGIFEGLGEFVFSGVKDFALMIIDISLTYQTFIATILQTTSQVVGFIATAVSQIEDLLGLDRSDLTQSLAFLSNSLLEEAKAAAFTANSLNEARRALEALSFESAKMAQSDLFGATVGVFTGLVGEVDATAASLGKLNKEIGESLTNVPAGVKVALARFRATSPAAGAAPGAFGAAIDPVFTGAVGTTGTTNLFIDQVTVIATSPEDFIEETKRIAKMNNFNDTGSLPVHRRMLGRSVGT